MLGVARYTVSDWLNAYDREGLDGFADDARLGRGKKTVRSWQYHLRRQILCMRKVFAMVMEDEAFFTI